MWAHGAAETILTTSDQAIQVWTLVVAAIAAIGALGSSSLTLFVEGRRSREDWLKREQAEAYDEFNAALWRCVDEAATGEVDRALQRRGMQGLDESSDVFDAKFSEVVVGSRRLFTLGGRDAASAGVLAIRDLTTLAPFAYPRAGSAHAAAMRQRVEAVGEMLVAAQFVSQTFRAELGLATRAERRARSQSLKVWNDREITLGKISPGQGRARLLEWRVRRLDGLETNIRDGWAGDPNVWESEQSWSDAGYAILDARVTSRPGEPWRVAIRADLDDAAVTEIEDDIARLVTANGQTAPFSGGQTWVEGLDGQRIYFWTARPERAL